MTRFRKDFNLKIISTIMSFLFLLDGTLYSYPMPKNSLRVPSGEKETHERIMESMRNMHEAHNDLSDPRAIDTVIKKYVDEDQNKEGRNKRVFALSDPKLSLLRDRFMNALNSSGGEETMEMHKRLQDVFETTGGKIQVIFVDDERGIPVLEGRLVWGHAGKYITIFALKGDKNKEGGKRKIIGRIFHEIRARSTRLKDILMTATTFSEAEDLIDRFEQTNRAMEEQIQRVGKIEDGNLRKEFSNLDFEKDISVIRDYTVLNRREFIKKALSIGAAISLPIFISGDAPKIISLADLLKDTRERPEVPYIEENYFVFGKNAFSTKGVLLGHYSAYVPRKIVDITTNKIIGWYNWFMSPAKYIYDISGKRIKVDMDIKKGEPTPLYIEDHYGRIVRAGYFLKNSSTDYSHIDYSRIYITDSTGRRKVAFSEPANLASAYHGDDYAVQAIMDKSSLSHYFFKRQASEKLRNEIKQAINNFNPLDIDGKILRIELVRRLIEIEIELGLIPDITINRSQTLHALRDLKNTSLKRLNDFNDPSIQRIVWNAIANVHPQFKLYCEVVKRLGLEGDAKILKRTLRHLKRSIDLEMLMSHFRNTEEEKNDSVDKDVKDILSGLLSYNLLSTPEEVFSYMKARFNEAHFRNYIGHLVPDKVVAMLCKGTLSEQGKKISSLSLAYAEAVALEREGYEASMILGRHVSEVGEVKVPQVVCFVTYKEKSTSDWYVIDAADFMVKKGLNVKDGLYKIVDIKNLENELGLEGMHRINAKDLALMPRSIRRYLKVRSQKIPESQDFAEEEFVSFFSSFRLKDYGDPKKYEEAVHLVIENAIAVENIKQFEELTKKHRIDFEFSLTVQADARKRKVSFVRATYLLPEKFISRLKGVRFKEEIPTERVVVSGVDNKGNLIYRKIKSAAGSALASNVIELASSYLGTTVHELAHIWENVTPEEIKGLFYSISWRKSTSNGMQLREINDKLFARPYGMTNKREDLAIMVEEYVMKGSLLRERVRLLMDEGKFELAAKYLFVKYVILKDYDGKFFEYEIHENPSPLTIDKVESDIKNSNIQVPEHITKVINKIKELAYNGEIYGSLDDVIKGLEYLAVTQCAI